MSLKSVEKALLHQRSHIFTISTFVTIKIIIIGMHFHNVVLVTKKDMNSRVDSELMSCTVCSGSAAGVYKQDEKALPSPLYFVQVPMSSYQKPMKTISK